MKIKNIERFLENAKIVTISFAKGFFYPAASFGVAAAVLGSALLLTSVETISLANLNDRPSLHSSGDGIKDFNEKSQGWAILMPRPPRYSHTPSLLGHGKHYCHYLQPLADSALLTMRCAFQMTTMFAWCPPGSMATRTWAFMIFPARPISQKKTNSTSTFSLMKPPTVDFV
jgi:hypothetical protein